MALIKCKECGKEMSDKDNFCGYCGYKKSKRKRNEFITYKGVKIPKDAEIYKEKFKIDLLDTLKRERVSKERFKIDLLDILKRER